MSEEGTVGFDYAGLVADALRGVVRGVLSAPGLDLPAHLRKQFPQEMTIVLQNQFWGLAVEDQAFSVQLRFGGKLERLTVPFAALVAFADPSVPFGLRFEEAVHEEKEAPPAAPAEPKTAPAAGGASDRKVVAFRSPRKKTDRRDS